MTYKLYQRGDFGGHDSRIQPCFLQFVHASIYQFRLLNCFIWYLLFVLAPAVYCTCEPDCSNILWLRKEIIYLWLRIGGQVVCCQSNSPLNWNKTCSTCKGAGEIHWYLHSAHSCLWQLYTHDMDKFQLKTHNCPCVTQTKDLISKQIQHSRKVLTIFCTELNTAANEEL